MVTQKFRFSVVAAFAIGAMALAGCDGGDPEPAIPPGESAPSPDTSAPEPSDDATSPGDDASSPGGDAPSQGGECSVHLFDGDNFDESDDHFVLSEPGRYENLSNLPGATKDWTDDADSIRVGSGATVTIWSDRDFQGQTMTLEPGSEHPDLDSEPSSLELIC